MKKRNIFKENWTYVVAFVGSLIISLLSLFQTFEMKLVIDNIGILFVPASLAGRDWTDLIVQTPYYGWAYYILYTPLFCLFKNPYYLYSSICILNIFVLALICVLIYHILIKFFNFRKNIGTACIAVICSTYAIIYSWNFSSELPALLIVWILAFFLLRACISIDARKKNAVYSFIVAMIIAYAYNVHTRLIMLVIAVSGAIVIFRIIYKKWFVQPIVFGGTFLCGFLLAKFLKGEVVNRFWRVESVGDLHNATTAIDKYVENFTGTFRVIVDIIISNFMKLNLETRGVMIICCIVVLGFLIKLIVSVAKKEELKEKTQIHQCCVVLISVFGIALVGTIFALPLYYGSEIAAGYASGTENGHFSAFSYLRYFYMYFGPLFVSMMVLLIKEKEQLLNNKLRYIVGGTILLALYVFFFVLPHLNTYYVNFFYKKFVNDDLYRFNFVLSILILLAFIGCMYFLIQKGKHNLFIILVLITIAINKFDGAQTTFFDIIGARGGDATYALFQEVQKDYSLPSEIYYLGNDIRDIQFMLNDTKVKYELPEEGAEEIIVISEKKDSEGAEQLVNEGYRCYQLDDNEYMWLNSLALEEQIVPYIIQGYMQEKTIRQDKIKYDSNLEKFGSVILAFDEGEVNTTISNPVPGKYRFSIDADVIKACSGEICELQLYVDEQLIQSVSCLDNEEKIQSQIDVNINSSHTVEMVIKLNKGAVINDLMFSYQQLDYVNRYGMWDGSELVPIRDVIEKLDLSTSLVVVSDSNEYLNNIDMQHLESALQVEVSDVIDGKTAYKYNRNAYVLLESDIYCEQIFSLVERYIILYRTNKYTLLVRENDANLEKISEHKINVLSCDGKINLDYFRMNENGYIVDYVHNILPEGLYDVELQCLNSEYNVPFVRVEVAHDKKYYVHNKTEKSKVQTFYSNGINFTTFNWLQPLTYIENDVEAYISVNKRVYQQGDVIDFSDPRRQYYYTNLYDTESWGLWSSSNVNELVFDVIGYDKTVPMELRVISVVPQKFELYANDHYLGTFNVDEVGTTIEVEIEEAYISDGEITLRFETEEMNVVADVMNNDDERTVGIGFQYILFE